MLSMFAVSTYHLSVIVFEIKDEKYYNFENLMKKQVFGNNSKTVSNIKNLTCGKNDQHIKIYLPCNFEVNLITHLGVIALFSSNKILKI
jgi:hypothetical protein